MSDNQLFVNELMATGVSWQTATLIGDIPVDNANVMDFGAVGDGVTDDAPAINMALNYVRAHTIAGHATFCLTFPAARYLCKSPLNFTGFNTVSGGDIEGNGSELWFQMSGGNGIDCTGSRWLRFYNLTVYGDPTTTPAIGIQTGRYFSGVTSNAGIHTFINVNTTGNFSFASHYNNGSENNTYISCTFDNNATGTDKFCLVQDGINHWNIASTFVKVTATVDAAQSFNDNTFSACTFQGVGSTGAIWISNATHHKFIQCYSSNTTASSWIFTIYRPPAFTTAAKFLEIDCHCENTALANVFMFSIGAGAVTPTYSLVSGFRYVDHACEAQTAVFAVDGASTLTAVEIRGAKLEIELSGAAPTLFDNPALWLVEAIYAFLDPAMWAMPAKWNGPLQIAGANSFLGLPTWTTSTRPTAATGSIGFALDTGRLEAWTGAAWNQYVRLAGDNLTGALIGPSFVATFAGSSFFTANTTAGNHRGLQIQTSGSNRWLIEGDTAAESGANAGTNLVVERWSDAGAFVDVPFSISRATGQTTIADGVAIGTNGPTITSGTGDPAGNVQIKGSIRLRTDGGVGTTLYVSQGGGTWNAVASV